MRRITHILPVFLLLVLGTTAVEAQTQPTYRGTLRSVRQLILRIENRSVVFQNNLNARLARNPLNRDRAEDNITNFASDFDVAVSQLRDRFERRESTATDVQEVLNRASSIDNFLRRHSLDTRTRNSWALLRTDLNQLARAYNVTWTPGNVYPPVSTGNNYPTTSNRLTGAYRLDVSRSDDPRAAAERATRNRPTYDRDRLLNSVTARLESPDQLAIDLRGRTVTIASSRAPQITFEADGRERTETTSN